MYKKNTLFILFLLITPVLFGEGFASQTLVRTELNYRPIETLNAGDNILSHNSSFIATLHKIKFITKHNTPQLIKITCGSVVLYVAPDQKFYSTTSKWVNAKSLTSDDWIVCRTGTIAVDDIEIIDEPEDVYALSPEINGNFYVSPYNILVFNYTSDPLKNVALEKLEMITSGLCHQVNYHLQEKLTETLLSKCNLPPAPYNIYYSNQGLSQFIQNQIAHGCYIGLKFLVHQLYMYLKLLALGK